MFCVSHADGAHRLTTRKFTIWCEFASCVLSLAIRFCHIVKRCNAAHGKGEGESAREGDSKMFGLIL